MIEPLIYRLFILHQLLKISPTSNRHDYATWLKLGFESPLGRLPDRLHFGYSVEKLFVKTVVVLWNFVR